MHIPDGFLSMPVAAVTYAASAAVGAATIVQAKKRFADRFVPLFGVTAAFIFAAQMINFPIGGGTSGHFLGAMLACLLLGPAAGFWIMTLVLVVQCLVFADGGITALGGNVFNMAVIGGIVPYALFLGATKLFGSGKRSFLISTFVFSWFSVVLAAFVCSVELGVSGTIPFKVVIPVMTLFHVVIGLGDALITTAVLSYLMAARPDLIYALKKDIPVGLKKEAAVHG